MKQTATTSICCALVLLTCLFISIRAQAPIPGNITGGGSSGGGTVVSVSPPFTVIGGTLYDATYAVTLPNFTGWTATVGAVTQTPNTNGDITLSNSSGSATAFFGQSVSIASIEADLSLIGSGATTEGGLWMFDGTNFWTIEGFDFGASGASSYYISLGKYGSTGTFVSAVAQGIQLFGSRPILKLSATGTTLTYSISMNDGETFIPLGSPATVGTITRSGIQLKFGTGTNPSYMDVKSMILH